MCRTSRIPVTYYTPIYFRSSSHRFSFHGLSLYCVICHVVRNAAQTKAAKRLTDILYGTIVVHMLKEPFFLNFDPCKIASEINLHFQDAPSYSRPFPARPRRKMFKKILHGSRAMFSNICHFHLSCFAHIRKKI